MTVNIAALIHSLGKSYSEIMSEGLIPYQTEPKGSSGSPTMILDMAKEGILLSFRRNGRVLEEIILNIQRDDINNWIFPNKLPSPLQPNMSRELVIETFGQPEGSVPPKIVMKRTFGRADKFSIEGFHIPITMQIRYDMNEIIRKITFLPTSELRW